MPVSVIERAKTVLKQLEKVHGDELTGKAKNIANDEAMQLSFFQLDDPVLSRVKEEILAVDINTLTPVEALMKLNEIRKMVGG
jgi:DNA mismatch repair protein MutS